MRFRQLAVVETTSVDVSVSSYALVPAASLYDHSLATVHVPRQALLSGQDSTGTCFSGNQPAYMETNNHLGKTKISYVSIEKLDELLSTQIDNDSHPREIVASIVAVSLPNAKWPVVNLRAPVLITFAFRKVGDSQGIELLSTVPPPG